MVEKNSVSRTDFTPRNDYDHWRGNDDDDDSTNDVHEIESTNDFATDDVAWENH